jgi:hypothetical protein
MVCEPTCSVVDHTSVGQIWAPDIYQRLNYRFIQFVCTRAHDVQRAHSFVLLRCVFLDIMNTFSSKYRHKN